MRHGLRLGRPLLSLPKEHLVAVCRDRGQGFFEDPSNSDPKYARARMRRLLALLAQEGLDPSDLARLAARAARAEQALAVTAAKLFSRLTIERDASHLRCDLTLLRGEPEEFLLRFLLGETERLGTAAIRLERAERLAGRLHAGLETGMAVKSTLGGLVISLSAGGVLTLAPEATRERGRKRSTPLHVAV
jgi:tRNA(Ile)-lysidine synthase